MSASIEQIIADIYSETTHHKIIVHTFDLNDLTIDTLIDILSNPLNYLQINADIDELSSFFLSQGWKFYQGDLEHYIHGDYRKGEKGYFKGSKDYLDLESFLYNHIEFFNEYFFIGFDYERIDNNKIIQFRIRRLSFKDKGFHHLYSSHNKNLNQIIYDSNTAINIDYSLYPEDFYIFCISFLYAETYLLQKNYYIYDPRENSEFYTQYISCLVYKNSYVEIDFQLSNKTKPYRYFWISDAFEKMGLNGDRQILLNNHDVPTLLYDLVFDKKELDLLAMTVL